MTDNIHWLADAPLPRPSLSENLQAEVAIIGGGFTGLSTAIHLKALEPDAEVVLLDQGAAGTGSSARNLGMTPTPIGNLVVPTLARLGVETTSAIHRAGLHGDALIERICAEHDIDCEFTRAGSILIATTPGEVEVLARQAEAYVAISAGAVLLDAAETARRFGGIETHAGLYLPFNHALHPGKLVLGMKHAALKLGVRIFDNSHCLEISVAEGAEVRTDNGTVRAGALVLATGGYEGPDKDLNRKIKPVFGHVIASAPLTDRQRAYLAWPGGENIYSAHDMFWCMRIGADDRLYLVDTVTTCCPLSRRRDMSDQPAVYRKMARLFRARFPGLADLEFPKGWGGRIAISADGLPSIGRLGDAGNVHFATGYSGRGVLISQVAGQTIAERIVGREPSLADNPFLDRDLRSFPADILTWAGINLTFAKLRRARKGS